MRGQRIGRRTELFQRYRILLFEDHLEEVSATLTSLEVKRFFFDEAEFATVHPLRRWPEVSLAVVAVLLFALVTVALVRNPLYLSAGSVTGGIALVCIGLIAYLAVNPPHKLVIHAPDEALEFILPRLRGRRERAVQRLQGTIESYQARHPRPAHPQEA